MNISFPDLGKYGLTGVGLIIGTAAKYGLTLQEGQRLTWRGLIADALQLGMVGLISVGIADWASLTGDARVFSGALAAVSSDRLIRLAREQFMQRMGVAEMMRGAPDGTVVKVDPGPSSTPATITVTRPRDPRAAGVEALAHELLPTDRKGFEHLIEKMDK